MAHPPVEWALEGRRYLVTGAARNIGRATARMLADAGASVAVSDVDGPRLTQTADEIARAHGAERVSAHEIDLRDPTAPAALVAQVVAGGTVDGIVHAAADMRTQALSELTVDAWDELYAVNVRAGAFLAQAALPSLTTSPNAAIVLCSSVRATGSMPGTTAYEASKGAIEALTRSLAVELAPAGIRVNAIRPGHVPNGDRPSFTGHPVYRLGRLGRASDIASMAAFLVSDAATWVTGTVMTVDGGMSAISPTDAARVAKAQGAVPRWRRALHRAKQGLSK